MWIMIAGPFRHGTDDQKVWSSNLRLLNKYAYRVFQKGHIPVIGVNAALPIIENNGWDKYNEIMKPVSLALAERCDAVLRIGGESEGADAEVQSFVNRKLPVFTDIEQIPDALKEVTL